MSTAFKPLRKCLQPLGVGIYDDVPAEFYHADELCVAPTLSSSIAVDLVTRSPAHARLRHPRLINDGAGAAEFEVTDEMRFGSVAHELLLGKGGGFAIWEGDSWRGKDAIAFRDAALVEGKTPIKSADFRRAEMMCASVVRQLNAMGLGYILTEGKSEQVAVWQSGDHWNRAMFDRWIPERGEIWDIKTTGKSAHPDQVARTIPTMNYDMRSEFYLMGASAITGLPARKGGIGYQFLFVETTEPFCVTPCFLDLALRERGKRRAQEAIDTWARCMESGVWPGYTTGAQEITAPGWVDYEIEDSEITTGQKMT